MAKSLGSEENKHCNREFFYALVKDFFKANVFKCDDLIIRILDCKIMTAHLPFDCNHFFQNSIDVYLLLSCRMYRESAVLMDWSFEC